MRIGVNLLFLVPGEVGGSEPLMIGLGRKLADSPHEVTIFGVNGFSRAYPELSKSCRVVEVPWKTGAQAARIIAENSWLALQARRRRLDLIHHGGGTAPFIKPLTTALSLFDIQYHHYPDNFLRAKRAWLRINVPQAVRRSDVTIVPSQWVRQDVASAFDIDADRVEVVPYGSDCLFGDDASTGVEVRERYRLERPFFFYPGRTYPHKNHGLLIEAFAPLADSADLVLTGAPWFRDRDLWHTVRRHGLTGMVRHLGLVPRRELAGLYQAATALTYPSRFEGFGAPALEAMSVGCPVIASEVTSIPEVVGDAGILLDPDDLEGWRDSMMRLLEDQTLQSKLQELGRQRAQTFSWDRALHKLLSAYEKALSR